MTRNWLFLSGIICSLFAHTLLSVVSVCNHCAHHDSSPMTKNLLINFCNERMGKRASRDRCCLNNETLIGFDASRCQLKDSDFLENDDKQSLQWLSIVDNEIEKSSNVTKKVMRTMINLDMLVVSPGVSCNNSFQKQVVNKAVTVCSGPINECQKEPNDCPQNSHCAQDGPGLSMCNCNDGWIGYRCLKKDGFPAYEWLIGFVVATFIICAALRLMQQKGRKAGKVYKESAVKEISDKSLNSGSPTPTPQDDLE